MNYEYTSFDKSTLSPAAFLTRLNQLADAGWEYDMQTQFTTYPMGASAPVTTTYIFLRKPKAN